MAAEEAGALKSFDINRYTARYNGFVLGKIIAKGVFTVKKAAVIGGGPAGLTAALYLARAGIEAFVFEGNFAGGKMNDTPEIENYPGFLSVSGFELSESISRQAQSAGAVLVSEAVTDIKKEGKGFILTSHSGENLFDAVVYAAGTEKRRLGIAGEEKFFGRGISYCALCDGGFYKGKTVFVIGGGNTAVSDAIYLSRLCKQVFLVHRRDEFRAEKHLTSLARKIENITLLLSAVPTEIKGDKRVSAIVIKDKNGEREYATDGVFTAIGADPVTALLKPFGVTDGSGYIIADREGVTSVEGLFAAGDAVAKKCRQIATAVGDGAAAATSATEYLERLEE